MSSALNSTSIPLGANQQFQGTYEFLNTDKHGVQVACSTDAEGVLVVEFSQNKNDIIYSHNFPIEVDVSFSRAVSKKANYYRVRLVNGAAAQTTLQLASIIQTTYQPDVLDIELDAATSSITMFGTDGTGTLRAVKTTADGSLVISGGGGGGGDATAANQTLQLTAATSSNTAICSRLDEQNTLTNNIVQILSDTVAVINYGIVTDTPPTYIPIKASNTGNLFVYDAQTHSELQGSNLAQYTKLDLIQSGTDINSGYLQSITTKITPLQQGLARYDLNARTTLSPDTVPAYSAPPSGIPASEGWYYKNVSAGNASQLYYYANLASQTRNHDYTISLIQSQWAVVRLLNLNSGTSLPFLVLYSQPQGDGNDFAPGFARSSWVYQVAAGQELRLGEKIILYQGTQPDSRLYPEIRRIQCSLTITRGPALSTEVLAYATVNTDSGAPVNTVEYIVSAAGLTFLGDNVYNVELTGETSTVSTSDATAANQVASNVAICSRLDSSNVVLASMATDTTLVLDELEALNLTYTSLQEGNSNLYVFDSRAESKLIDCVTELQFINGSLDAVKDGTSQFWVHTTATDDSVEIHGYNPVLLMPEPIHTVDNAAKVYVNNASVSVSGDVGLVAGTQVGLTAGSTVQLVSSEVALASGTVVGLVAGTSLDVLNFPVKQSVFVENTAEGYDINVNVTNTGSLNTNITNGSIDVNCYGVHDGTPTLLKTTSVGELVCHSQSRDGSGASITSTEEGAKRGLDVNLINSVGVQNVSGTSLQVGKPNAVVSTLYTGAISASFLGNADLDGFSSFDLLVFLPANSVTTGGNISICVSDNGTDWYITTYSVFVSVDTLNDRRYTTTMPSLNSRYVAVTGLNPFGGASVATTNSTIKISAKK